VNRDAQFSINDRRAPFRIADAQLQRIAAQLHRDLAAAMPRDTGHLSAAWETAKVRDAHYHVRNPVPYARHVEYGTRTVKARPVVGRVVAAYRARWRR
jgi:hypothetical protein